MRPCAGDMKLFAIPFEQQLFKAFCGTDIYSIGNGTDERIRDVLRHFEFVSRKGFFCYINDHSYPFRQLQGAIANDYKNGTM